MNTTELKNWLIEKIRDTNDSGILEEVYRLLEISGGDTEVYILDDAQKAAIREGREQIERGEVLTAEEADKEIDEWLKK